MTVALFDLDNTLLDGDSDYLWGEFLCDQGVVNRSAYRAENARYFQAYKAGTLDIHEFLAFGLRPLATNSPQQLYRWRDQFVAERIVPIIPAASHELLASHRARNHQLVIVTATNRFVTEPIAAKLGVTHLLASTPEMQDGCYTGKLAGTPCFHAGKVTHVTNWLAEHDETWQGSWFYSDSHNDLPLLERADHPVAVNPDNRLRTVAAERGWPVRSLRVAEVNKSQENPA